MTNSDAYRLDAASNTVIVTCALEDLNVLVLDREIRQLLAGHQCVTLECESRLSRLQNIRRTIRGSLSTGILTDIDGDIERIRAMLLSIRGNDTLILYDIDVKSIIGDYNELLCEPIEVSFVDASVAVQQDSDRIVNHKILLVELFLTMAKKYLTILFDAASTKSLSCRNDGVAVERAAANAAAAQSSPSSPSSFRCHGCNRPNVVFENTNDSLICTECGCENTIYKEAMSYKDIDRITISSKYIYDRRIHFRDCINQYQGKQNCVVQSDVFKLLDEQFVKHHLIDVVGVGGGGVGVGGGGGVGGLGKRRRWYYRKITKEHVAMFLKELDLSKHYDNINLIHWKITDTRPDDISHLENILMEDFMILTELYDKKFKNIDRKNFINTQYVLYQLLIKHKHKCNINDITIFKTPDLKLFHDDICKTLFEELGWNTINPA
jgi:ribosomal protein S27E